MEMNRKRDRLIMRLVALLIMTVSLGFTSRAGEQVLSLIHISEPTRR